MDSGLHVLALSIFYFGYMCLEIYIYIYKHGMLFTSIVNMIIRESTGADDDGGVDTYYDYQFWIVVIFLIQDFGPALLMLLSNGVRSAM